MNDTKISKSCGNCGIYLRGNGTKVGGRCNFCKYDTIGSNFKNSYDYWISVEEYDKLMKGKETSKELVGSKCGLCGKETNWIEVKTIGTKYNHITLELCYHCAWFIERKQFIQSLRERRESRRKKQ